MQTEAECIDEIRGRTLSTGRPKIVAVDGPAGSGKSSICHTVADHLGWTYINTGALYRAVGVLALSSGINLDDQHGLASMVDEVAADLRWDATDRQIWHLQQNLTAKLQTEEAGYAASKVAKQPLVRDRLLPLQRQLTLSAPKGALVDGRDIGTVVFPDADLKIFLTASLEERSRRRMAQLSPGAKVAEALEDIKKGLARRDERDEGRGVAPLKQAVGAVVLDTSLLNFEQTVEALERMIRERGLTT